MFKADVITMLNNRKYAHDQLADVINLSREIRNYKKVPKGDSRNKNYIRKIKLQ